MNHTARGLEYARRVIAGDIPAGKYVRLACRRQFDDLAKQRTPDFPFYFDEGAAGEHVCEFIECLQHVTDRWARTFIRLEPWQSFNVTTQFGWLRVESGMRRFREIFMLEPRKNGKSTIEAAIGLYMLSADGEEGAQIYCGATKQKQAMFVFKPAWLMVARDPEMQEDLALTINGTTSNPTKISQEHSNNEFTALIGNPGDGGNPHLAIIDEYHEHKDDKMYGAMRMGMGTRQQPMLRVISTAGVDISGPCYQKQLEVQQILDGLVRADDVYGIIYGVDEDDPWDDIETAIKANPNYGVSVQPEAVYSELAEAKRNPAKQSEYKTKRLNIWVGSRSPFFNLEMWLALGDKELTEAQFEGETCWGGSDLASKIDLSSHVKVFKRLENDQFHYYLFGRHYLPEERIVHPDNPNKQFIAWRDQGWIIPTNGAKIDNKLVRRDILEDAKHFHIGEWAYDPYNAAEFQEDLEAEGLPMIEVRMNPQNLSAAMKEWQALILDSRIHHNGDPVLAWAVGNCTARIDANENYFPRKERAELKIDPVVAGILAIGRAMLGDDGASVYESRGVRYL